MAESELFNRRVGDKLRLVRKMRDLSLHDLEKMTNGEFKASVLGAYERGERALSVHRLVKLAELLEVPVIALVPDSQEPERRTVNVDLAAAERLDRRQSEMLDRFLKTIQVMRKGATANEMAVRSSDLEVLAAILEDRSDATEDVGLQ